MSATWSIPRWPSPLMQACHSLHPRALRLRPHSRPFQLPTSPRPQRCLSSQSHSEGRLLLTLAIETSCDDTCVAVLEKTRGAGGAARLLFNKKITSDNRQFRGVHPMTAVASHTQHLAEMVREAMRSLPEVGDALAVEGKSRQDSVDNARSADRNKARVLWVDGQGRQKPDFVTVTRGPGMTSNLSTGLNTAKGLAVAWDVPLLGVNHMQAHALTPRLVSALEAGKRERIQLQQQGHDEQGAVSQTALEGKGEGSETPAFPFLSLLVSGGHSLLVLSRSLNDHAILAEAHNIAIGDMLDKCARAIVPPSEIAAGADVMYGPMLERFAFPDADRGTSSPNHKYDYEYVPPPTRADEIRIFDSGRGWHLTPPLSGTTEMAYEFAGLNGQILKILLERPDMAVSERRLLARQAMRLAFEHLASRLLLALSKDAGGGDEDNRLRDIRTVVVAGGVASNRYLMHILRSVLDVRGYGHIELACPPLALCTDNAAMIAWTGMEMYEAGWRSELGILAIRKWPLDPNTEGGGILGAPGWKKATDEES